MPKVALTNVQKIKAQKEKIANRCNGLLAEKNIKKKVLASYLDVTPTWVSAQFRNKDLQLETIIAVITLTKANKKEIARIFE